MSSPSFVARRLAQERAEAETVLRLLERGRERAQAVLSPVLFEARVAALLGIVVRLREANPDTVYSDIQTVIEVGSESD